MVVRRTPAPLTALVLALALAACASDDAAIPAASAPPDAAVSEAGSAPAAAGDAALNEADVTFLQNMIPHHEQANEMADLVAGRTQRPELEELAEGILAAQGEEIEEMRGLLEAAGEDAGGMEGMEHGMEGSMPGMMDEAMMTELQELQGPEFDQRFVEMMIEHHEGAIQMAQDVLAEGQSPDVADLANRIIKAQEAEVEMMRGWQEEWA
jgi:uncharacterized protein (DUF305 family)